MSEERFELSTECFCAIGHSFGGEACAQTRTPLSKPMLVTAAAIPGFSTYNAAAIGIAVGDGNGFAGGYYFYDAASGELAGALAYSDEGFASCPATEIVTGRYLDSSRMRGECTRCDLCEARGGPLCERDDRDVPIVPE